LERFFFYLIFVKRVLTGFPRVAVFTKTKMIEIRDISNKLLFTAPVTEKCIYHHELMKEEYVQLSFQYNQCMVWPAGAWMEYKGRRFSLLDPYTPTRGSEDEYSYEPRFESVVMSWKKQPFFFFAVDEEGEVNSAMETDWSGTMKPGDFLDIVQRNLWHFTGEEYVTKIDASLTEIRHLQFQSASIFEALSRIADAWETEWWVEGNEIHLSRCYRDVATDPQTEQPLTLEVGRNIQVPTINADKEGYYNRFYAFGSTRNMVPADTPDEGTVAHLVNNRLRLPEDTYPLGYKDMVKKGETLQPGEIFIKTLVFDHIYPRSELTVGAVYSTFVEVTDDNGDRIVVGEQDGKPLYKVQEIFYVQLRRPAGGEGEENEVFTEAPEVISGNLGMYFEGGALSGWEFEAKYFERVQIKVGQQQTEEVLHHVYCINYDNSSGILIPNSLMAPQEGDPLILLNVKLPQAYVEAAQLRLEEALDQEMERRQGDRNTYEFDSNPVDFYQHQTDLQVGQKVIYIDGDHRLETRVLSVEKNLDEEFRQHITIGEERIIGSTQALREEVAEITENVEVLRAISDMHGSVVRSYQDTQRKIQDGLEAIGRMWELDKGNPIKDESEWIVRSRYNVVSEKAIVAQMVGRDLETGGSGSGGASCLYELIDVENKVENAPAGSLLYKPKADDKWDTITQADLLKDYVTSSELSGKGYLTSASEVSMSKVSGLTAELNKKVDQTISIGTGAGLTGGGALNQSRTLSLQTTGVSAGTYPKVTVDAYGRVTAGTALAATDIPSLSISKITDLTNQLSKKADKTVKVTAGTGLSGGGTLAQDLTLSLATSGVTKGTYPKVTVDEYGRVTAGTALTASDIPSLAISKITNLESMLKSKMDQADFNELFEKVNVGTSAAPVWAIRAKMGLYSDSFLTAGAINSAPGSGPSYDRLDSWSEYTRDKEGHVLSAGLGYDLHTRVLSLEDKAITVQESGTGNAYTSYTYKDNKLTLAKGQTFLTASALSGYATEQWVSARGYLTASSLNGYATEKWVEDKGYLTSASLSGYATEKWVEDKGYLTATSAASSYVTLSGTQTISGSKIFTGDVTAGQIQAGHLYPKTTGTYDLGQGVSSLKWRYLYTSGSVFIGNHIYTNGKTSAADGVAGVSLQPSRVYITSAASTAAGIDVYYDGATKRSSYWLYNGSMWYTDTKAAIGTSVNSSYTFYVAGSSRLNGNTYCNGGLAVGDNKTSSSDGIAGHYLTASNGNMTSCSNAATIYHYFQPSNAVDYTKYVGAGANGMTIGPRLGVGSAANASYSLYVSVTSYTTGSITTQATLTAAGLIHANGNIQSAMYVQIGDIQIQYDAANKGLKIVAADGTSAGLYATSYLSAHGIGSISSPNSGLIESVQGVNDWDKTFILTDYTNTFNAYAIQSLYTRIVALEGKAITVAESGTGNAYTSYTYANNVLTLVKGATFLTASDLSATVNNYVLKSGGVMSGTLTNTVSGTSFDSITYTGTSWNNGYGALGVAVSDNTSQTPLIVARRAGSAGNVTGENRLFAIEFLNSGSTLRFAFGGVQRFQFGASGGFYAGNRTAYTTTDPTSLMYWSPSTSRINIQAAAGTNPGLDFYQNGSTTRESYLISANGGLYVPRFAINATPDAIYSLKVGGKSYFTGVMYGQSSLVLGAGKENYNDLVTGFSVLASQARIVIAGPASSGTGLTWYNTTTTGTTAASLGSLYHNGSNLYWNQKFGVGIDTSIGTYQFYVNGTSYFTSTTTIAGSLYMNSSIYGNGKIYARGGNTTTTATATIGPVYTYAALEIREANQSAAASTNVLDAPALAFHWSGRFAACLSLTAAGVFSFINQSGNGYSSIKAAGGTFASSVSVGTTLAVSGTSTMTGAVTMGSSLSVGAVTAGQISSNAVVPRTTGTYSLGGSALRWLYLYTSGAIYGGGGIYSNNKTSTTDGVAGSALGSSRIYITSAAATAAGIDVYYANAKERSSYWLFNGTMWYTANNVAFGTSVNSTYRLYVSGTTYLAGAVTGSSTLTINGTSSLSAVNPRANNTYALGTTALRWSNVCTTLLNVSSTVTASGWVRTPYAPTSWLNACSASVAIEPTTQTSEASAHCLFRIKSFSGDYMAFVGLKNNIGFYGVKASRITAGTNGTDWATRWDTSTGLLTHTAAMTVNGQFFVASGTASTSTTTGALRVTGGVGISGALYAGSNATITGTLSVTGAINNNTATTGYIRGYEIMSGLNKTSYNDGKAGATLGQSGNIHLVVNGSPHIYFYRSLATTSTSYIGQTTANGLRANPRLGVGIDAHATYTLNTSSFICQSWVRTVGNTGWYSETHGGGMYMTDTTYVRTYGSKAFYVLSATNSTSPTSGAALKVDGGVAVAKDLWAANLFSTGAVTAQTTSDRAAKFDFREFDACQTLLLLGAIMRFRYKKNRKEAIGPVYQDVVQVLPQMDARQEGDTYGSLNYLHPDYINLIAASCQQTIRKVETISEKVDRLEKENSELKQKVEQLKKSISCR